MNAETSTFPGQDAEGEFFWEMRRADALGTGDVILAGEDHLEAVMVLRRPGRLYTLNAAPGGPGLVSVQVRGHDHDGMMTDFLELGADESCLLVACGVPVDYASMTAAEFSMIGHLTSVGGFDPTEYGMGSDYCPVCGVDWKEDHEDDCESPWRREELLKTVRRLRGLDRGEPAGADEVTGSLIALCRKAGLSAAEALFEAERIRDAYRAAFEQEPAAPEKGR